MKKGIYAVAFLAGSAFAAFFFGAKAVDIRIPVDRFWVFCGYALAAAFIFTLFEEFMKRVAKSFGVSWLTEMLSLLAVFFFGVALVRFACLMIQGPRVFLDPVAVGFFLLSLSLGVGIIFPKLAIAIWSNRSRRIE